MSADGDIVAGMLYADRTEDARPFRWSSAEGTVALPLPVESVETVELKGMSSDGSVLVGEYFTPEKDWGVFRWTRETGYQSILPGVPGSTTFKALSADGQVIAGWNNFRGGGFLWKSGQGVTWLGSYLYSALDPVALSADGSVLLARAGNLAIRRIGSANEVLGAFQPRAISADGTVVLAIGAAVWDSVNGLRSVERLLAVSSLPPDTDPRWRNGLYDLSAMVTRADEIVLAGNHLGPVVVRIPRSTPAGTDVFDGTLLQAQGTVRPSVSFKESYSVKKVRVQDAASGDVTEYPAVTFSSSFTMKLPLRSFDPASVNAATRIQVFFGDFEFSETLAASVDYVAGATKAKFELTNFYDEKVGELVVDWTTTLLSLSFTVAVTERPPEQFGFTGTPRLNESNSFVAWGNPSSIMTNNFTSVRVAFGDSGGSGVLLGSLRYVTSNDLDHELISYASSGSLHLRSPGIRILSPAPNALVVTPLLPVLVRGLAPDYDEMEVLVRVNGGPYQYAAWFKQIDAVAPIALHNAPSDFRSDVALQEGDNLIEIKAVRYGVSTIIQIPVKHVRIGGSYTGLIADAAGATAGSFSLRVSPTRALSGKLLIGTKTHALKGTFASDGTANVVIPLGRGVTALLSLNLHTESGDTRVAGSVDLGNGLLTLDGQRAWSGGAFFPWPSTAAQFYSILLPRDPALAAGVAPHGSGFATLTVAHSGATKLVGKLADGTSFSHGGTLDETYALTLLVNLYSKGVGNLSGTLRFNSDPGSDVLTGTLRWFKPPTPRTIHPGGFTAMLPARGAGQYFGGFNFPFTGQLVLSGAGSEPPLTLAVTNNGRLIGMPATAKLRATIDSRTGIVTGTFFDAAAAKKRPFALLIGVPELQSTAPPRMEGYFIGETEGGLATLEIASR